MTFHSLLCPSPTPCAGDTEVTKGDVLVGGASVQARYSMKGRVKISLVRTCFAFDQPGFGSMVTVLKPSFVIATARPLVVLVP